MAAWGWQRWRATGGSTVRAASILTSPKPQPTPIPAPWSNAQRLSLRDTLRAAFAPALQGAQGWSLAVHAADGRTIFADHADHAVAAASTQKLIVASTALDVLGPTYRYRTALAAENAIGADGTLAGNLWLVGSGDPSLRSHDLRLGVAALAARGLRRIDGGIRVDASAIAGPEINPHWEVQDTTEDYGAPTSGLSIDDDTVEFRVTGTSPGAPASVRIVPASDAIRTTGSVTTSGTDGDSYVVIAATNTPNFFRLSGDVPTGIEQKYWLPLHDVPRYAGAVLERMLHDRGIAVGAPIGISKSPLDAIVLWEHRSAPLRKLERHMLFVSDNHYAEQLLRTIGGQTGIADDAGGLAAERAFLNRRGIPTPGLILYDGSGLSPANRVAAATLAGILSDAELRGGSNALYLLLPAGGRQGTLKEYDFTTALGYVRAKSGHISGVSSLAGYVHTRRHGRIVFAFLIDGSPGDPDAAIVRAVNRLAGS